LGWILVGTWLVFGLATAVSCNTRAPDHHGANVPAPSAERAAARKQRAARQKAFDEQGDRPKKSKTEPERLPPPEPEPLAIVEPETSASAEAETPPPDAGTDTDAASADAGDAGPPDAKAICNKLCDRVIACADELDSDAPVNIQGMVEAGASKMRERCMTECLEEAEAIDDDDEDEKAAKAEQANACLEEEDCDDFIKCIRALDES
jgi:hypothetical protein